MKPFTYERAKSPAEAAAAAARTPDAKFIAGGTNLLDLMKLEIETPTHLIDVNGLGLDKIEPTPDGGLRIGALVRNTDLAADERVRRDYGVLSRALRGRRFRPAAQQGDDGRQPAAAHALPVFLRHQPALQQAPARQRLRGDRRLQPPAGGDRRRARPASRPIPATWRWRCACSTPTWRRSRPTARARTIPIADFHRLPGTRRRSRHALAPGELITAVTLPKPVGGTHIYHKVRDRASYAFALVSVAAVVQRDGTGASRSAASRPSPGASRRPRRSCRTAPRR